MILQSSIVALWNHIRLWVHQTCSSLIDQLSTMAPRNLFQDTVEYNCKISLVRKMLKSKKCPHSLFSLKSTRSTQLGRSARVPVEPIKSPRNLTSSKDQGEPQVTKKSQDKCDQVLDTPMAELKENYETLLSMLRPSGLNTSRSRRSLRVLHTLIIRSFILLWQN